MTAGKDAANVRNPFATMTAEQIRDAMVRLIESPCQIWKEHLQGCQQATHSEGKHSEKSSEKEDDRANGSEK